MDNLFTKTPAFIGYEVLREGEPVQLAYLVLQHPNFILARLKQIASGSE